MNRFFLFLLVVFSTALLASSVAAEDRRGWPTLALTAGGYDIESFDLRSEPLFGIHLGYEFNPGKRREHFALELVGQQISGEDQDTGMKLDVSLLRLDALYFFPPIKALLNMTPFLTVGGGGRFTESDDQSDSEVVVCYGAGFKLPVTTALALRVEGRQLLVFSDPKQEDYSYTVGLQWTFGKAEAVKKNLIFTTDTDMDGIFDNVDQCSGTPAELKVNARGCPVNPPDGDSDSIPDYLDLCPGTVADEDVNNDGCLPDSDQDGIPDIYDKCPNNPPGFEVNSDGCMKINH